MLKLYVDLFAGLPGTLFLGSMGHRVCRLGAFRRPAVWTLHAAAAVRHRSTSGQPTIDLARRAQRIGNRRRALGAGRQGNRGHQYLGAAHPQLLAIDRIGGAHGAVAGEAETNPSRSLQQAVAMAERTEPERDVGLAAFLETAFAGPHHYAVFLRGKTP